MLSHPPAEQAARFPVASATRQLLPLSQLDFSAAELVRDHLDDATVESYADEIQAGATLPELKVVRARMPHGEQLIVVDGRHSGEAHRKRGIAEVWCLVIDGTETDAVRFALSSNAEHGLRRSRKDKRAAITLALKHPEFGGLTDRDIGRLCRVNHETVGAVRAELVAVGEIANRESRTGSDGKTYAAVRPAAIASASRARSSTHQREPGDETEHEPEAMAREGQAVPAVHIQAGGVMIAGEKVAMPPTRKDIGDAEVVVQKSPRPPHTATGPQLIESFRRLCRDEQGFAELTRDYNSPKRRAVSATLDTLFEQLQEWTGTRLDFSRSQSA